MATPSQFSKVYLSKVYLEGRLVKQKRSFPRSNKRVIRAWFSRLAVYLPAAEARTILMNRAAVSQSGETCAFGNRRALKLDFDLESLLGVAQPFPSRHASAHL